MRQGPSHHVVIVGPVHPYRGGIAHFGEQLGTVLEKRGHEVTFVTFSRQYPAWLFPGKSQQVEDTDQSGYVPYRWINTLNPVSWWIAAQRIKELRPDVVIFQHWMPYFAPTFGTMARILRLSGLTTLVIVHNALPHERHLGDRWLTRYLFNACDKLITLSATVADQLHELNVSAPVETTLHPMYDRFGTAPSRADARHEIGLPQDARVLLFFGFIREYKGLMTLLEALPQVRDALSDIRLVIAGEFYDDEGPYRSRIEQLQLNDVVHLEADYIPDEKVATYFSAANVVVQPYIRATQSGVAHIAFHFDQPLIVTDVGGLAELIPHEKAGLVVPPKDPEALASAIIRFFEEKMEAQLTDGVKARSRGPHGNSLPEAIEAFLNGR